MKKIIIFLMAVLAICFMSCADSKNDNPKVIGTAYLQYDSTNNLYYAVIDSTEYPVSEVFIPGKNAYSQLETSQIMYLDEVYVTLFTSPHLKGVRAVIGKQTEDQIRQMHKSYVKIDTIARVTIISIVLILAASFLIYKAQ